MPEHDPGGGPGGRFLGLCIVTWTSTTWPSTTQIFIEFDGFAVNLPVKCSSHALPPVHSGMFSAAAKSEATSIANPSNSLEAAICPRMYSPSKEDKRRRQRPWTITTCRSRSTIQYSATLAAA